MEELLQSCNVDMSIVTITLGGKAPGYRSPREIVNMSIVTINLGGKAEVTPGYRSPRERY